MSQCIATEESPVSLAGPPEADTGATSPEHGQIEGTSRRRYERVAFNRKVRVTELDEHGAPKRRFMARAFDLSRAGIGLRAGAMAYQGRSLILEVIGPGRRVDKVLYGVVRQIRYEANDGYVIGVEFRCSPGELILRQTLEDAGYLAAPV